MYMIGILGCLRIYQARHHDVFVNGHFAYAGFAAVIFTAVIGVVSCLSFLVKLRRIIPYSDC